MKCMFCKQDFERVIHNDKKVHTYRCPQCHYLIDISAKDDVSADAQPNQKEVKNS